MENITNKKVAVKSTVKAVVSINVPDLMLKREWRQKGAIVYIEKQKLEEALYDPGVEYLFKNGMLYIENMQDKIALGLEEEGAAEPQNILVLTEAQMKRYLTVSPIHELKSVLGKLAHEQKLALTHYAIDNAITDMDKTELLKKETDIDVLRAVIARRENLEADKK